tara:strand:- start:870 stop:1103 length:234 start_codon:yes stop_codon:yes gene_type:complete
MARYQSLLVEILSHRNNKRGFMIRFICVLMTTASAIATFLAYKEWWIHGDLLGVAIGMTIMTMIGIYTTILGDHNEM